MALSESTCQPLSVPALLQCWLRRRPHAWQTSVSDRLAFRESYMGPEAKQLNNKLVQLGEAEGFVAVSSARMFFSLLFSFLSSPQAGLVKLS